GWAASQRYLSNLAQVDVFGGLGGGPGWGEPVNILVVGSDDRSGLSRNQRSKLHTGQEDFGRHTDTILLVHLSADLSNASVVSIPRDSLVTIPSHTSSEGEPVPEHKGKVNSAFSTGGPSVTVKTVQAATGVTINHYVEVNFSGFLKMVDAVGGVDVCLKKPLVDQLAGLNLPAGNQTIRGRQALGYVRARHIDNDFGRVQRQQTFIAAILQKLTQAGTLLNPVAMNSFVDAAVSSVTTDENLSVDVVAALAARMADVDLSAIKFTTVPVSDGNHFFDGESTVLWDAPAAKKMFDALAADQPLPEPPKPAVVEVAPGEITVTVAGAAGARYKQAMSDLTKAGFDVSQAGSGQAVKQTTIRYDPQWQRSLHTLKAAFPNAKFISAPGTGGTFTILVGDDYSGIAPVRAAATSVENTVRTARDSLCS
ncbi:MAG: LCP family protein, partial [Candidatus Nanopelagicales bacterium]|nr:LCP family protein [Candidatus Nanopelagicales bacterium]